VLIGEVEREVWDSATRERLATLAKVVEPGTCLDLLNELSSAGVFVGNDSGPGHLAGILGIPTVVVFGPSNPTQWKPLGPHVSVLHANPIDAITVNQVVAEIAGHRQ
jgi:ADP-heptose:LPS heptosyltransferase